MEPPFCKILIANRGEIAIRIARAAYELGIRTVGIFAYEDRFSLHRYKTDESYQLGDEGNPRQAYLDIDPIIALAKRTNCEAIHPGYGFLSENSSFAALCDQQGIKFIGPSPYVLEQFGDKVKARNIAEKAGLPIIPGTKEPIRSIDEAIIVAEDLGYPVTIKAVSGGGGKGIRIVSSPAQLSEAIERTQSEAEVSFGKAEVYLEKTVKSPKHIEVQILGDSKGNLVHLYERDCSIQRRNQKVVEIAPALGVKESIRKTLQDLALKSPDMLTMKVWELSSFCLIARVVYFLEVNPRVQVEHTVTEMITGGILFSPLFWCCRCSLDHPFIAASDQQGVRVHGTAIQCRITTEDPLKDFAPTGQIIAYRPAVGFGIRLDEGLGTSGGLVFHITIHCSSKLQHGLRRWTEQRQNVPFSSEFHSRC